MSVVASPQERTQARTAIAADRDARAPLRVLTMTTLFPSSASPRHGIFVETRLRKLRASGAIDLQVIAPVPWFPIAWSIAGRYATYAATPRSEERHGVTVRHPRFLSIPRVGMTVQPAALAASAIKAARALLAEGWTCDVIDAHYLYPDGVAAATLARELARPFVVTARGSDVNLIAQMPGPRRRILASLAEAGRVIAVSEALKNNLVAIGVPAQKVEVLRNGVDLEVFAPATRAATNLRAGIDGAPLVVAVGNLLPEKGHDLVLRAVSQIDGVQLIVVGDGPERASLHGLARQLGMASRMRFLGNMPQAELASIYGAADVLALGSVREGWPNVLLEAMACGTPVVATKVGGVGEIVTAAIAGELVDSRDAGEFAAALRRVLQRRPERSLVRAHAMKFSWEPVVHRYREILGSVAQAARR